MSLMIMRAGTLALNIRFVRTIAERLLFREATAAELWVLDDASDIAISIDEFDYARNAN